MTASPLNTSAHSVKLLFEVRMIEPRS